MQQLNLSHWNALQSHPILYEQYRRLTTRRMAEGVDRNTAEMESFRAVIKRLSLTGKPDEPNDQ